MTEPIDAKIDILLREAMITVINGEAANALGVSLDALPDSGIELANRYNTELEETNLSALHKAWYQGWVLRQIAKVGVKKHLDSRTIVVTMREFAKLNEVTYSEPFYHLLWLNEVNLARTP